MSKPKKLKKEYDLWSFPDGSFRLVEHVRQLTPEEVDAFYKKHGIDPNKNGVLNLPKKKNDS